MVDILGVEFDGSKGHLHDGAGGEGTDKGADAYGAAEKPANEGSKAEKCYADCTDRYPAGAFCKRNK